MRFGEERAHPPDGCSRRAPAVYSGETSSSHGGKLVAVDDGELLARAERALTEIKVNQGLSEEHAAVLAALRIRLKGSDTGSLEDLLQAAADSGLGSLDDELAADRMPTPKPSLDDLFAEDPKPKPDWPS